MPSAPLARALVAALLLVAAAYMLAPRAAREAFIAMRATGNGVSSTALFARSDSLASYRTNLAKFGDVRDDADDPLVADACYKMPPDGLSVLEAALARSGTLYGKIQMHTISGDDLKTKIVQHALDAQKRAPGERLVGPVHVLLTQAPFYRDDEGREMMLQYTIRDYLSKPYNIMLNGGPKTIADVPPIFVTALVVYAGHTADGKPRLGGALDLGALNLTRPPTQQQLADAARAASVARSAGVKLAPSAGALGASDLALSRLESRDKLCFLACPQTSAPYPTFCGCATGTAPYASTCLGPSGTDKKNADAVAKATFFFAYRLNARATPFVKNRTFEPAVPATSRVGDTMPPLR